MSAATGTPPPVAPRRDIARVALSLARWFDAGATMWCASPSWPHHARHVAVEFVHPVMVGKRALPAIALPSQGLVESIRSGARPGDVVVLVAPGGDPDVDEVVRRAPAWGVHTVWVGAGPRPETLHADHVLWAADERAHVDGQLILLYHLLWELTHVCLEHASGRLGAPEEAEVCVTCADEGRVGEVQHVGVDGAVVRVDGDDLDVDTTLVEPVGPHDLVLVHAGTVIARLDATSAGGR